ncbi:Arginine decarboxylase [Anoxybacillus sp. P3H1B]|uniref:aminotransferase class I/II-fold pyridoxal phosphate-dependent enzyme n=1 Tax=Anoxybacillus sp. P3H1B TaxID=1769293 RepID=UPI000796AF92|nr:aminotransferase class I/II-fold pyridoxal phosphate-dependent enzyme [Anoxybacillus sp. P3H1B]KXG08287.1 Arginine decarboxylase [Anoxybacillus sp. P3H1B]
MSYQQQETPLYTALKKHFSVHPISFHVPGHKYGNVFLNESKKHYKHLLRIDVTELNGLDDLHQPESVIAAAQRLTAELYGVDETFFLINGSTVGNLAMIFATCEENEPVIVQRNCHKSIIHALQLVGAVPVFLSPQFDDEVKVASYVSNEAIKQAIEAYPNAKALILTNPNYYGMAVDLKEAVSMAHRYGIPVLVDEAHGAHFILGDPFPSTAITYGADVVVQSAHKTLPAMTMGSYLHVNSSLVDIEKLHHFLRIFQSSSPSYPIMASLDLARSYLAHLSIEEIGHIQAQVSLFKKALNGIEGIAVVESTDPCVMTDLLKITVQTRSSLSGYELQRCLEQAGIFTELADPLNVLFVYPLALFENLEEIIEKIKKAFSGLHRCDRSLDSVSPISFAAASEVIPYSSLKKRNRKFVHVEQAEGLIAAETIIPYPPGIPLLIIGEIINGEHIASLLELRQYGSHFQGGKRLDFHQIEVFE